MCGFLFEFFIHIVSLVNFFHTCRHCVNYYLHYNESHEVVEEISSPNSSPSHLIRWEEVLAVPGFLHFHLCFRINILEKKQQPHLLWILVGIALNQSIINLMRIWHLSILSLLAQEHDLSSFKALNEVWQLPPHKTYLSFIRCNPMFIKFLFLL